MRKVLITLPLLLLPVLTGCSAISEKTLQMVNRPAPYTRITMLDGNYIPLSEFRGKTTVLAFWATWCSHSKKVMKELSDYALAHHRPDVAYVGISIDRNENFETVNNMAKFQGLNGVQHAFSGNDVHDETFIAFDVSHLPTIIVIGPNGVVKGVGTDLDVVREQLEGKR